MPLWTEIKQLFSDESLTELADPTRAGVRVRKLLLLVRETTRSVRRNKVFIVASSLAFQTLLSLIPVMAISLAILAMMGSSSVMGPDGREISYTESFVEGIKSKIPEFPGIDQLIESIRGFADNAKKVAVMAFILLFGTAFSLLNSIESAFNSIWQVKEQRPLLAKGTAYLATLFVVPLLISSSVYLTTRIARATDDIESSIPFVSHGAETGNVKPAAAGSGAGQESGKDKAVEGKTGPGTEPAGEAAAEPSPAPDPDAESSRGPLPAATGKAVRRKTVSAHKVSFVKRIILGLTSLVITCLAMTALFYLMPFTVVRVRAALAGGITAGIMFELAIHFFRFYANRFAGNYTALYGTMLAIPLFLLWVWLVWAIVLFGAEFAFTVQNFRDLAARAELETRGISSRLYLGVRTVQKASACFVRGENPVNLIDRVAEELEVPPYMVREVVSVLVSRDILRRVEPAGEDAYLPAKDITRLTVGEVIRSLSYDTLDVPEAPDDPLRRKLADMFGEVQRQTGKVLDTCTLAELG